MIVRIVIVSLVTAVVVIVSLVTAVVVIVNDKTP